MRVFGEAFAKAQLSAGTPLPDSGTVFISVNDRFKADAVDVAKKFAGLGFKLVATARDGGCDQGGGCGV